MKNLQVLTQAQLDFFFREGYVIISGVYNPKEVHYLREFFKEKFTAGFWKTSRFDSPTIINDIYRHFPEITGLVFKPEYIDAVKDIYNTGIICVPECCIHYNRFFDWHRDTTTLESTGETAHLNDAHFMVQASIYLQDNCTEGGGLTLVPRSQTRRDRFVTMYRGNYLHRIYHKMLKATRLSAFHMIERNEHPVDVPTKAGDVVIFNNQLDHKATFIRHPNGKAQQPQLEKFAIFNTFCNDMLSGERFLKSLQSPDEPYARFLRQTLIAPALQRRSEELGFSLCYPQNMAKDHVTR